MHLAQWQALKAAGGPSTNYSMDAVAGMLLIYCIVVPQACIQPTTFLYSAADLKWVTHFKSAAE